MRPLFKHNLIVIYLIYQPSLPPAFSAAGCNYIFMSLPELDIECVFSFLTPSNFQSQLRAGKEPNKKSKEPQRKEIQEWRRSDKWAIFSIAVILVQLPQSSNRCEIVGVGAFDEAI